MKPGEALLFSYERLQIAVAASQRVQAFARIELAAGIGAAFGGSDSFTKWLDAVMQRIEPNTNG